MTSYMITINPMACIVVLQMKIIMTTKLLMETSKHDICMNLFWFFLLTIRLEIKAVNIEG